MSQMCCRVLLPPARPRCIIHAYHGMHLRNYSSVIHIFAEWMHVPRCSGCTSDTQCAANVVGCSRRVPQESFYKRRRVTVGLRCARLRQTCAHNPACARKCVTVVHCCCLKPSTAAVLQLLAAERAPMGVQPLAHSSSCKVVH